MKIASLTPLRSSSDLILAREQLPALVDGMVLDIQPETPAQWNDYGNRLVLLAKAARRRYDWVLWVDADEMFDPGLTGADVLRLIDGAIETDAVAITFQRCDMWDATHWRTDGIWGQKRKVVLQKNPLMETEVKWRGPHLQPLHATPLQEGGFIHSDLRIYHFGWNHPFLRREAVDKYRCLDPEKKYQPCGYDYILDETGLTLERAPF